MDGGNDAPAPREAEVREARVETPDGGTTADGGAPARTPDNTHDPAGEGADGGTPTRTPAGTETPPPGVHTGAETPAAARTGAGGPAEATAGTPPARRVDLLPGRRHTASQV
jgi:hypothetical protein